MKGFTLVELLVVVGIIAILAVVGITIYSSTLQTSRDSKRQQDIQSIAKALETHYNEISGVYPSLNAAWFINPESQGTTLPADPLSGEASCYGGSTCDYCFEVSGQCNVTPVNFTGGTSFKICANLESNRLISSGVYCISNQR